MKPIDWWDISGMNIYENCAASVQRYPGSAMLDTCLTREYGFMIFMINILLLLLKKLYFGSQNWGPNLLFYFIFKTKTMLPIRKSNKYLNQLIDVVLKQKR